MLVLAAIIVVALLTNASLDRTTSRSITDRYQAEIAAQNGLEAAKKALVASPNATTPLTGDDSFLVIRVDAPAVPVTPASAVTTASYYYLAKAQSGAGNKIDYYPLFAGGSPTTGQPINLAAGAAPPSVTRPTPPPNPSASSAGTAAIDTNTAKTSIIKAYPAVSSWLGPPSTQWLELHDPTDTATTAPYTLPYQRYTFWVEDLAGYLDASVVGNIADTGNVHKRPLDQSLPTKRYQTSPGEIALFTIFDPVIQPDSGSTGATNVIQSHELQFTIPTLKTIAPAAGGVDTTSPFLATGLRADSELPLVPYGYAYADEGIPTKPRLDINSQVATGGDPAVQAIWKKINDNLPTFAAQRQGGLGGLDYVKTIAASMIDYADKDSNATLGPDYRGYDSYPLVNEIYSMKWWTGTHLNAGKYFVTIQMDTWIELWNPSNQTISGTASINILENLPVQAGIYTYTFGTTSSDLQNNGSTVATIYPSGNPITVTSMQPNEYTTYHVRTDTFDFNTGVEPPLIFPASSSTKLPLTGTVLSNYQMTWTDTSGGAGGVVDKAGGGIQRISGSLSGPPNYIASNKNWRGSYPGSSYNDNPEAITSKYDNLGDPRASFYLGRPASPTASPAGQAAVAYAQGSSFWVRNNRSNVNQTAVYSAVKPSGWPDRGHDTALVVTAPPTAPVAQAVADPPLVRPASAPTEPTKAPASISNAGSYATVAEFGSIFDPAQWNIVPVTPPDGKYHWDDITNSTAPDSHFGGGITLRIGRPEFTKFDQPGVRAWQLLDLFYAGNRINTRGLININTASRDVLRALGAGVLLNRDPDISFAPNPAPTPGFYPPFTAKQADVFADAVIAARPFLSAAQLSTINVAGTSTPLFGNPSAWSGSPPSEWNDSGTEEYFAKVLPLATVRGRNFRIFVTGQALDKSGKVLSTVSKVFQVYVNPVRDPVTGKVTSQKIVTTYETQLFL
jgi:hypothetical protein